MIKAIVLDVDGVIVGEKVGYNSPYPHPEVTAILKKLRDENIPIVLCTAKPLKSVLKIIEEASLHNLHITDAGAVVYDPIDKIILKETLLDNTIVRHIVKKCLDYHIYTEFYTRDNYYMEKSQENSITPKHTHVLQFPPIQVGSLLDEIDYKSITKVMMIAEGEEQKQQIIDLLAPFTGEITLNWGSHPYIGIKPIGFITNKNVSKKIAVEKVIQNLDVSFEDVLAVGDSTSDWSFMQLAGFVGTLENAKDELKELVKTKGEEKYFIGKSVDENGILDILNYFIKS